MIRKRDSLKEAAKYLSKEEKINAFKEADSIREVLKNKGILLEDTPYGTR